jgi:NADPH:quinone reductase-like Zn-dependent oxidoreductase
VYTRYGSPDVLRLTEVDTPTAKDGEVLVRVRAVSLNLSDWESLRGTPLYARVGGVFRPRRHILGSDIAGRVEAVGAGVTRFTPGDDVFADILSQLGGFAEYVAVPERLLAPMPAGMSHDEAAALPQAGVIALQGILEKGRVRSGQRVLINGAGGGSGMYAVQLAKLHGATVTGVDNGEKQDFMRSVGADHVLDYTREDYTRTGRTYDLILDLAAYRSVSDYRRALAPDGRYLMVGGSMSTLFRVLVGGGRRIRVLAVRLGVAGVAPMADLCRAGKITTIIDRRFPLAEVPAALSYVGGGHAKGKVVITVE